MNDQTKNVLRRGVTALVLLALSACRPSSDLPPEPWAERPVEEWPDLVFTNDLHFSDTTYVGIGNSFLIDLGQDTVAASVKHIFLFLRDQLGLETVDLGPDFVGWDMRSLRQPDLVFDVGRPINENPSEEIGEYNTLQVRDWLVFDLDSAGSGVYPLRLRQSYLRKGEAAFAVGRNQEGRDNVHPKLTPLRIYDALGPYYFVESFDSEADHGGTSGSPVVDRNGHLVGIVSGAMGKMGVVTSVEYFLKVVGSRSEDSPGG